PTPNMMVPPCTGWLDCAMAPVDRIPATVAARIAVTALPNNPGAVVPCVPCGSGCIVIVSSVRLFLGRSASRLARLQWRSFQTNPRVKHCVENVHQQAQQEKKDHHEQDRGLHHRIVARTYGFEQQAADAGIG